MEVKANWTPDLMLVRSTEKTDRNNAEDPTEAIEPQPQDKNINVKRSKASCCVPLCTISLAMWLRMDRR